MPVIDYESSASKTLRMSRVAFWLLISFLGGLTIAVVSLVVYAGLAEYGREFVVVNLLLWGTPCVLAILALCIARFRED
jgi:hypothetical protein